jgi:hypothetical protein
VFSAEEISHRNSKADGLVIAMNKPTSLRAKKSRHCERSVAIHDHEFGFMDCRAALAVTMREMTVSLTMTDYFFLHQQE